MGVFIYDRSKDLNTADTKPAVRPAEARTRETSGLYPRGQVTRLIMETGDRDQEQEQEDRRTPVDLQDIVEKLNNAIRDAKSNMNTQDQDPPVHRAT